MTQVKAKKSLGQNFLKDEEVLSRIAESADLKPSDTVVEIGPGTGALTRVLAKKAGKVIAFEVDKDLIPGLLKQFPISGNVSIVEQDILKADMAKIVEGLLFLGEKNGDEIPKQVRDDVKYKVVANIPYYITAPIIQYLLELPRTPETIVLMIQKEVAERITAEAGDMSILAVSVQYYADPELLFTVSRTAFDPVPQVESAVVRLTPKRVFDKERDKKFFRVVRAGFSARRKTLVNNLSASFHMQKETVSEKLVGLGFDANIRAQALSVADWERVTKNFLIDN